MPPINYNPRFHYQQRNLMPNLNLTRNEMDIAIQEVELINQNYEMAKHSLLNGKKAPI